MGIEKSEGWNGIQKNKKEAITAPYNMYKKHSTKRF